MNSFFTIVMFAVILIMPCFVVRYISGNLESGTLKKFFLGLSVVSGIVFFAVSVAVLVLPSGAKDFVQDSVSVIEAAIENRYPGMSDSVMDEDFIKSFFNDVDSAVHGIRTDADGFGVSALVEYSGLGALLHVVESFGGSAGAMVDSMSAEGLEITPSNVLMYISEGAVSKIDGIFYGVFVFLCFVSVILQSLFLLAGVCIKKGVFRSGKDMIVFGDDN